MAKGSAKERRHLRIVSVAERYHHTKYISVDPNFLQTQSSVILLKKHFHSTIINWFEPQPSQSFFSSVFHDSFGALQL